MKVPDARVDALAKLFEPKKKTYAEITFTDLAGGHGEGLDRGVLNAMRPLDALCQVRARLPGRRRRRARPARRDRPASRPRRSSPTSRSSSRASRRSRRTRPRSVEIPLLERLQDALESEQAIRELELTPEERKAIAGYTFLTLKPLLLVLNVGEDDVAKPPAEAVVAAARERGLGLVVLSGAVEMDIAQMEEAEQTEFLASLGLEEPAKNRFIRGAYELLDLISMLTAGPDECRAWPVPRGTPAPRAAGKIHSDIERGFIRAEVVPWQELIELGSEAKCRDAGQAARRGQGVRDPGRRRGELPLQRLSARTSADRGAGSGAAGSRSRSGTRAEGRGRRRRVRAPGS